MSRKRLRYNSTRQVKNIVRETKRPSRRTLRTSSSKKSPRKGKRRYSEKNRTKKGIVLGKDERDNRAVDNCVTRKTILSSNINLSIFFVSLHLYCRKRFLPWHTQNSKSKNRDRGNHRRLQAGRRQFPGRVHRRPHHEPQCPILNCQSPLNPCNGLLKPVHYLGNSFEAVIKQFSLGRFKQIIRDIDDKL